MNLSMLMKTMKQKLRIPMSNKLKSTVFEICLGVIQDYKFLLLQPKS